MAEVLQSFLMQRVDLYFVIQMLIFSAAWALLGQQGALRETKRGRFLVDWVLLFCSFCLMNFVCFAFGMNFLLLWSLSFGAITLVYFFIRTRYHLSTRFALWCSLYVGMLSLNALAGQLSYLSGYVGILGDPQGALRDCVYFFSLLLAALLRKVGSGNFETIPPSGIVQILVGCVGLLLMQWMEAQTLSKGKQVADDPWLLQLVFLVAYVGLFADVVASIYSLYSISREHQKLLELQIEQQRLEREQELTEVTRQRLDALRTIRHDIKNQYGYMRILLQEKRYPELESYFDAAIAEPVASLSFLDCGNSTVNTILNLELSKAQQRGIRIEHKLVVPPALPFREEDLCSLLTNLLDNALEETCRLGRGTVSVAIHPQRDYLFICVKNPTDKTGLVGSGAGLATTKKDKTLHGYGTRIVANIAAKYNGAVEYRAENGEFSARVLLDLMQQQDGQEKQGGNEAP